MRNGLMCLALAGLMGLLFTSSVQADRLLVETVRDSRGGSVDAPRNGQSMEQVVSGHGEPMERLQPVGEPPISRWVYEDYTVYFERDRVLHTVLKP